MNHFTFYFSQYIFQTIHYKFYISNLSSLNFSPKLKPFFSRSKFGSKSSQLRRTSSSHHYHDDVGGYLLYHFHLRKTMEEWRRHLFRHWKTMEETASSDVFQALEEDARGCLLHHFHLQKKVEEASPSVILVSIMVID